MGAGLYMRGICENGKKIAKCGSQSVICIPKILEDKLKPGDLTQIIIEVFEN